LPSLVLVRLGARVHEDDLELVWAFG
jgi:hypothetical protein